MSGVNLQSASVALNCLMELPSFASSVPLRVEVLGFLLLLFRVQHTPFTFLNHDLATRSLQQI